MPRLKKKLFEEVEEVSNKKQPGRKKNATAKKKPTTPKKKNTTTKRTPTTPKKKRVIKIPETPRKKLFSTIKRETDNGITSVDNNFKVLEQNDDHYYIHNSNDFFC